MEKLVRLLDMKLSTWNIRGLNEPLKSEEVKKHLHTHTVGVMAIIETRVKVQNKPKLQKKFGSMWKWCDNYSASPRGRIWLAWTYTDVDMTILDIDEQYIHTNIVEKQTQREFYFTFVYGLHTVEDRRSLWSKLKSKARGLDNYPWGMAGDFNAMLLPEGRENGSSVTAHEMVDFEEFLQETGITEVQMRGPYYTWSNKSLGSAQTSSRLDRVLANTKWLELYAETEVKVCVPGISDHSPQLSLPGHVKTGGRPFKFLHYMADHSQFEHITTEG